LGHGPRGAIRYRWRCGVREDGEHLFGGARIETWDTYHDAVRAVYAQAFALIWKLGYTELLRVWNLVGRITGTDDKGVENYAAFCLGRRRGIRNSGRTRSGGCPPRPASAR